MKQQSGSKTPIVPMYARPYSGKPSLQSRQTMLTPPFTAYDKRVLYQVYDITEYVIPGENKIEVTCGNGKTGG